MLLVVRMTKHTNATEFSVEIPASVTDVVLPDPYMLDYYMNLERRVLWIDDEIDEGTLDVVRKILAWNEEDAEIEKADPSYERRPITLFISSPGGYLEVSLAIAQCIRDSKTPVVGINVNECSSGAALIHSQCHTRLATDISYWLIHLGSGSSSGTFQQKRAAQRHHEHLVMQMAKMLCETMGLTMEEFEKLSDDEWYLYADDTDEDSVHNAKKYNLF